MKTLWEKIKYHSEWVLLPLFLVFVWGALHGYQWLVGSATKDDPGEIVATFYHSVPLVVVIALTGFTQGALFGWRGDEPQATRGDHILDALCTFGLLIFFAYCLWH